MLKAHLNYTHYSKGTNTNDHMNIIKPINLFKRNKYKQKVFIQRTKTSLKKYEVYAYCNSLC